MKKGFTKILLGTLLNLFTIIQAQDKLNINLGADLVSRYVWRGYDIGNAPNIQPYVLFNYQNFELGFWGSYALSQDATKYDELNFWLIYSNKIGEFNYSVEVIDYFFPNDGIKFGNFRNHDNEHGPGGHLINVGGSFGGHKSFPLTLSANINVYNDSGNNAYIQLDYPLEVENTELEFFAGAAFGSKENYSYYMTDKFNFVNIGFKATRKIEISDKISIPLFISYVINPRIENSYLVFGISI